MTAKPSRKVKVVQHKLEVYVVDDCSSCERAQNFVAGIINRYANLKIDLFNLSNPDTISPDNVFATPTYILNGSILFLGNPSLEELDARFKKVGITRST